MVKSTIKQIHGLNQDFIFYLSGFVTQGEVH